MRDAFNGMTVVSGDNRLETGWSPTRNDRTRELYSQDEVGHCGRTPLKCLLTVNKIQAQKAVM